MGIDFLEGIPDVDFDSECWKTVKGFPDFEISSLGRMKDKRTGGKAATKIKDGYRIISMMCPETKKWKDRFVHRLVALHFIDNIADEKNIVDHINGNRLDNRLCNLRFCTISENSRNVKKILMRNGKPSTSTLKGVSKKPNGKYQSSITYDGTIYHIGIFNTEKEAGEAYDKKAKELHKEFARLNFN